jgi:hypothetical protein
MFLFRLLWWLTVDAGLALGSLPHVEVDSATDVSETRAKSKFRIKGSKVGEYYSCISKIKIKGTLRLTVNISWCPDTFGAHDQVFISV